MSKPRLSNLAPVAAPATDAPALLFITLEAAPGVGALRKARAAIAHMVLEPCRILGPVNGGLSLHLEIADPGCCHRTERLALRLFRIAGINRVRAERRCPRRGVVYAIHLAAKGG